MPPNLSQEVLDIILDHLHDDHKTLRACALTCHSWVPTSQLHLFSAVKLASAAQSARFLALVARTPAIASYVRDLDVVESRRPGRFAAESENRGPPWLDAPEVGLQALCPLLRGVRDLCIDGVVWLKLSTGSLEALKTGCSDVRDVTLLNCTFASPAVFRNALRTFKALEGLNLAFAMFESSTIGEEEGGSDVARVAVRRLRYIPTAAFPTSVLLKVLDLAALEGLTTVCKNDDTVFYVNEICRGAGSSLELLTIHCGFDDNVPGPTIAKLNLSAATRLRSLKIDFINVDTDSTKALFWLAEFADSSPSPILTTVRYNATVSDVGHVEALDWTRIGTLHERRPSVELVTLTLLPIEPCDEQVVFNAMAARFSDVEGKFRVKVLLGKGEGR